MNISWDAKQYTEKFSFVHQYGNELIELIHHKKGSDVLDLGCGNGALTHRLTELGMHTMGMDASKELLEVARKNYPNIPFIEKDATAFTLIKPVDVVFSNAVFHWIDSAKQLDMLKCVYNALNTDGEFIFEFGGYGNNELIHNALRNAFENRGYSYIFPFYFPTIGEYTTLLEQAGFSVVYAVLFDRLTELDGEDGLYDWIQLFVKSPFKDIGTEEQRDITIEARDSLRKLLFREGKWYADYVRIRCKAIKK